jgi:DNA mismatch repair ATPase MutS
LQYHSLLEDWKNESSVKLGHMECIVEDDHENDSERKLNITFLYTLGDGPCPKSFGVNVARLAGLPDDVLQKAKAVSSQFEAEMNGEAGQHKILPSTAAQLVNDISALISNDKNGEQLKQIWNSIQ